MLDIIFSTHKKEATFTCLKYLFKCLLSGNTQTCKYLDPEQIYKFSIKYHGPTTWNNISPDIRHLQSLHSSIIGPIGRSNLSPKKKCFSPFQFHSYSV